MEEALRGPIWCRKCSNHLFTTKCQMFPPYRVGVASWLMPRQVVRSWGKISLFDRSWWNLNCGVCRSTQDAALTLGISLLVIFILTLETRSHLYIWRRISVGNRRKSKLLADSTGSHDEFKLSVNISGLVGLGSAVKISWPRFRGLPGDCGTANLRSDRVKVEASVVKSVMVRSGVFDLAGQVKAFTGLGALRTMSTPPMRAEAC
jgi:hypothetical protein